MAANPAILLWVQEIAFSRELRRLPQGAQEVAWGGEERSFGRVTAVLREGGTGPI